MRSLTLSFFLILTLLFSGPLHSFAQAGSPTGSPQTGSPQTGSPQSGSQAGPRNGSPALSVDSTGKPPAGPAVSKSGDGDSTNTFQVVEIESAFPGGSRAWLAFLTNNMVYPEKAVRKKIQGIVLLQFIVDKQGNLSDLRALSGDPILAEAALKTMEASPRWNPAYQKGRPVKSYKRQPIIFKLAD